MNKKELIQSISIKANVTAQDAEKCLNAFMKGIEKTLAHGNKVMLIGFGTFETKKRNARDGRNPKTGDTIHIPSSNIPSFKAGKGLKDAVQK
jgi:DNA-binding protein HU-beta